MSFEPRNPDYRAAVLSGFECQPFMGYIGARVSETRPGFVEVRVPFRQEVGQNHGFFHGGVIGSVADVAGGFAGFSLLPAGSSILTVEYKLNIIAPGLGSELIGRGNVLTAGKTLIFTEAKLYVLRDGAEHLCAVMLQTLRAKIGGHEVA